MARHWLCVRWTACLVEAVWPVRGTSGHHNLFSDGPRGQCFICAQPFYFRCFFSVNRQNLNATLTCTNVCNQKVLCCKIFSFQPRNNSFSGVDLSRVILVTPTLEFVLFVGAAGADWVRDVCVVSQ